MPRKKNTDSAKMLQTMMDNAASLTRSTVQYYEMLFASSITIGLRLSAIAQSYAQQKPQDMVEINRMVSEKNAAFLDAGSAVARWQDSAFKNYQKSPNPLWVTAPLSKFDPVAMSKLLAAPTQWTALTLKGLSQTMKPYHTKSTANARRLSGKKRGS